MDALLPLTAGAANRSKQTPPFSQGDDEHGLAVVVIVVVPVVVAVVVRVVVVVGVVVADVVCDVVPVDVCEDVAVVVGVVGVVVPVLVTVVVGVVVSVVVGVDVADVVAVVVGVDKEQPTSVPSMYADNPRLMTSMVASQSLLDRKYPSMSHVTLAVVPWGK